MLCSHPEVIGMQPYDLFQVQLLVLLAVPNSVLFWSLQKNPFAWLLRGSIRLLKTVQVPVNKDRTSCDPAITSVDVLADFEVAENLFLNFMVVHQLFPLNVSLKAVLEQRFIAQVITCIAISSANNQSGNT
jgi:hypothetical protein